MTTTADTIAATFTALADAAFQRRREARNALACAVTENSHSITAHMRAYLNADGEASAFYMADGYAEQSGDVLDGYRTAFRQVMQELIDAAPRGRGGDFMTLAEAEADREGYRKFAKAVQPLLTVADQL